MRRITFDDLDISAIDGDDADLRVTYDEVFRTQVYHYRDMRVPDRPTILDLGANVGLYTLWAHRYRPRAIYCYEASPRTFASLQDNIARLVDIDVTRVTAFNRAMAAAAGRRLVLHQSTRRSGISTVVDPARVGWIAQAARRRQLESHTVTTSTVTAELDANALGTVDILKIDVEGYFLEVLKGIAPRDYAKIHNIVVEADYLPETGIRADDVQAMLESMGYATHCFDPSQGNNLIFYAWRG
jgi:FkbM family methyltransferase